MIANKTASWLAAHAGEIYEDLATWVACNSAFPNELPLQRDLAEPFMAERLGLDEVVRQNVCEEAERPFVLGKWKGSGGGRSLLLNGHIDTIGAPGSMRDRWDQDPWQPVVKDGRLYGRGASDMKGGAIAMLWALRALKQAGFHPRGDVFVQAVPGEESMRPEIGTLAATRWLLDRGESIDFAVVTEPTHLEVHVRGIGQMDFSIELSGKEIHTSMRNLTRYPQRHGIPQGSEVGVDALEKMTRVLLMLEDLERQWAMRWQHPLHGGGGYPAHEDVQGVGAFSIVSTFAEAGTYEGSVPGWARIRGLINYPSWLEASEIKAEFERALHHHAQLDDWLRAHPPVVRVGGVYDWPSLSGAHDAPGPQALARAAGQVLERPAVFSGAKFVGDATFLQRDYGIPVVYFGPGDCSMGVHGPNEYVPLEQVLVCAQVLAAFVADWCG